MHYYTHEGQPRHFVPMTSRPDEMRPTRTTDAKKHGWVPSVTTVMNVLAKPALVNWKVSQHVQMAYQLNPADYETCDDWLKAVSRATETEMDKAPDAGTNIHNMLEAHFLCEDYPDEYRDLCNKVVAVVEEKTGLGQDHFLPEQRFAHDSGYAGMCDLSSYGSIPWVIDYKTKQTADKFKPGKMAYPDHSRQLAAYREGLGIPNARCANVFICIENGEIDFHEHKESDLQKGWGTFKDSLAIWQRENFDTSFKKETE